MSARGGAIYGSAPCRFEMVMIDNLGGLMQQLTWLDSHIGTIEEAVDLLNSFHWNISIRQSEEVWYVLGGEKVIFQSNQRDSVDAFLYGLALGYAVLPTHLQEEVKGMV
jgi:hypothetical protein